MVKNYCKKNNKSKFVYIFILLFLTINIKYNPNNIIYFFKCYNESIQTYQLKELCKINIKGKIILIFEPYPFHYECTPGFAKYFIDLGYNVDILMHYFGKDSFCLFEKKDKIRIILYENLEQIHFFKQMLIRYMNNYSFILVQTVTLQKNETISNLELLTNNKAIYVFHYTKHYEKMKINIEKNRIWTLGNFYLGLQVNPHYFGRVKLKDKNKKTRFFIVSTKSRNYNYIISSSKKIKRENIEFEIYVVGYAKSFSIININKELEENFIFNYNVNYSTLYKIVDNSDYIIINLDPDKDKSFKNQRISGSAQLSYGFLKPAIINNYFKDNYFMSKENSFLFDKEDFYNVMKKAILQNNEEYKKMQSSLLKLSKDLYKRSVLNVQKTLNHLLNN